MRATAPPALRCFPDLLGMLWRPSACCGTTGSTQVSWTVPTGRTPRGRSSAYRTRPGCPSTESWARTPGRYCGSEGHGTVAWPIPICHAAGRRATRAQGPHGLEYGRAGRAHRVRPVILGALPQRQAARPASSRRGAVQGRRRTCRASGGAVGTGRPGRERTSPQVHALHGPDGRPTITRRTAGRERHPRSGIQMEHPAASGAPRRHLRSRAHSRDRGDDSVPYGHREPHGACALRTACSRMPRQACAGFGPTEMGCAMPSQEQTLRTQKLFTGARLEVVYSKQCRAAWALVGVAQVGDIHTVSTPGGSHERARVTDQYDADGLLVTPMIDGSDLTGLQACFIPAGGRGKCLRL